MSIPHVQKVPSHHPKAVGDEIKHSSSRHANNNVHHLIEDPAPANSGFSSPGGVVGGMGAQQQQPSSHHHGVPLRVGFYEIEKTIGRGNFAVVKLAKHRITKTEVSITVKVPERVRFWQENVHVHEL